jgi:hypothetical protein
MELKYHLVLEDFLTHQLFQASKSKRIRFKRLRNWLLPVLLYGISAAAFFLAQNKTSAITFFLLALFWLFFYPWYSKLHYRNHYRKHLEEHYTHRIGVSGTLKQDEENLYVEEESSDGRISYKLIQSIIELPDLFLLKLKNGSGLMLPKKRLEKDDLASFLKGIVKNTGLKIIDETSWKWK